jgi:hypothetical protein
LKLAIQGTSGVMFYMGMQGCFIDIGEADLNAIFQEPKRLRRLLDMEVGEAGAKGIQQIGQMWEAVDKSLAGKEIPQEIKDYIKSFKDHRKTKGNSWRPETKPKFLDIDKAWHGIHFMLTGGNLEATGPLAFIMSGGQELQTDDFGYGPPHAFTADQVQEIHRALTQIDPQSLYEKTNPSELSTLDIYPGIWESEPKEESIGYLKDYLKELQAFVKQAADSGAALIAYIG